MKDERYEKWQWGDIYIYQNYLSFTILIVSRAGIWTWVRAGWLSLKIAKLQLLLPLSHHMSFTA